jgi:glutaredoxin
MLLVLALSFSLLAAGSSERIVVFTQPGCPYCERAKTYLAELAARRPGLEVVERDIVSDPAARDALASLFARAGTQPPAVPAFEIGSELVVGFRDAESTGRRIEALLDRAEAVPAGPLPPATIRIPFVGALSLEQLGLPLFTLLLGLLDGFNPCAMWVLLFLLSLLVHLRSRARMLAVGGTFVLVSGLWYFALMAAWLNVFLWIGWLRAVQIALGVLALAIGAIHLKDALAPGRGPTFAIPERVKPGIYARARRILLAENLAGALAAAAVLAALVNSVELLCTAGLPALYTQVLSMQPLSPAAHAAYLGLYVGAYMLDDSAVLALAVATLGSRKLQERQGRWLNGLTGLLVAALGLALLLRPQLLGELLERH